MKMAAPERLMQYRWRKEYDINTVTLHDRDSRYKVSE